MTSKITPSQLAEKPEEKLKEKLKEIQLAEKEKLTQEKAQNLGLEYINLFGFSISDDALNLIPKKKAEELKIICFLKIGKEARIAVVNYPDKKVDNFIEELKKDQGLHIVLYLVSEHSFESALKMYERLPKIRETVRGVKITEKDIEKFKEKIKTFRDLSKEIRNVSITDLVSLIIATAIKSRASDIHIEAEKKDIKVRFRIDGVLHDVADISKDLWKKLVSRIKFLSGLLINVSDKPQDGRFTIYLKNEEIDVRVSCLPTNYGESIVLRLLMPSTAGLEFEELGLRGRAFEQLKREIQRPNGMIITTGPTGSGKTTTLYAILKKLNKPEVKIITLEDPVEYRLEGINQSQIDTEKGFTFAKGLRSILRQDPDVIMVGEIRDLDTAETAINAALTGHLVISTLHTNSAPAAIPRFLAMGVKPFLLAPALNAVIGQRLVRRICPNCKEEIKLEKEKLDRVKKILSQIPENSGYQLDLNNLKFYQGKGCEKCDFLGYKGRIGIYEVLTMNKEVEKVILSKNVSEYEMEEVAKKQGMISMVQDGLLKAIDGITTVEEVFRVTE